MIFKLLLNIIVRVCHVSQIWHITFLSLFSTTEHGSDGQHHNPLLQLGMIIKQPINITLRVCHVSQIWQITFLSMFSTTEQGSDVHYRNWKFVTNLWQPINITVRVCHVSQIWRSLYYQSFQQLNKVVMFNIIIQSCNWKWLINNQ